MKRPVTIVRQGATWLVRYLDRQPRGRYLAAQFYAPDNSYEDVVKWVHQNSKLDLVAEVSA